jgi:hypothetical protein
MRSWRSWGLEDNHLGGRFKLEKWWKMWILVTNKDIYFANQTDDFIQQKDWTQQNVSMWKILVIWGFFQALKPSQTHTHWIPAEQLPTRNSFSSSDASFNYSQLSENTVDGCEILRPLGCLNWNPMNNGMFTVPPINWCNISSIHQLCKSEVVQSATGSAVSD